MDVSSFRAVLFDAGNTLCGLDHGRFVDALGAAGLTVSEESLRRAEAAARPAVSEFIHQQRTRGRGSSETLDTREFYMDQVLRGIVAEPKPGWLPVLCQVLEADRRHFDLWSRVPAGTEAMLDRLESQGIAVGVVSNSDGHIRERLQLCGLLDRFQVVVDSQVVGFEKPDPRIFQTALDQLAAAAHPAEALYVGDLYHVDVLGARAAGLAAALVDPYDDWGPLDCPRVRSVAELGAPPVFPTAHWT